MTNNTLLAQAIQPSAAASDKLLCVEGVRERRLEISNGWSQNERRRRAAIAHVKLQSLMSLIGADDPAATPLTRSA